MKILFTSDLHGNKNAYKQFASLLKISDIGILGGDLSGFFSRRREENEIRNILENAGKTVLFIMGNMDRYEWNDSGNMKNINEKSIISEGQKFAGYHYTTPFSGGIFEKSESLIKKDLEKMEQITDHNTIFVSHGPPYGVLDKTGFGKLAGSKSIKEFTEKTKPRYHLFGHIHEAAGIKGNCINGAYQKLKKFVMLDTEKEQIGLIS